MRGALGQVPLERLTAKGWVTFTGLAATVIRDSYGVSSVTYNGTGDYTVNWVRPFGYAPTATGYAVMAMCKNDAGNASVTASINGSQTEGNAYNDSFTRFLASNNGTTQDASLFSVVALGV